MRLGRKMRLRRKRAEARIDIFKAQIDDYHRKRDESFRKRAKSAK